MARSQRSASGPAPQPSSDSKASAPWETFVLFHYPACGTCKKALAWLKQANRLADVQLRDIVQQPPTAEELLAFARRANLSLRRFFNTSGQSYRTGGFKERLDAGMTEEQMAQALAADGKLIKRPLLVALKAGGPVCVGFSSETYAATVSTAE